MLWIKYAAPVVLIAVSGWFGYDYGVKSTRADMQAQIDSTLEEQSKLIEQLQAQKPVVREKVRTIYVEKDDTGCADTAIPDGVLSQLKPASN